MTNMNELRKMLVEKLTEAHFEAQLQLLDRVHDAATLGTLNDVTELDKRTLIGWLDDLIFTAEETIREIEATEKVNNGWQWTGSNN